VALGTVMVATAGNPPPSSPVTAKLASVVTNYIVQPGDTLSRIAAVTCGNPADYPALAAASDITDPDKIYPNQNIVIDCNTKNVAPSVDPPVTSPVSPPVASGDYSCTQLENLWEQAGGVFTEALMAAKIAMAESSGNPSATDHDSNGTTDEGLWQINTSNGILATYDPLQNAKSAVTLSDNGTNWTPWVTFQKNLYESQCT
jgi:hypothetical protein